MPFANEPIGSHRVADQLYGDCGGGGKSDTAGGDTGDLPNAASQSLQHLSQHC